MGNNGAYPKNHFKMIFHFEETAAKNAYSIQAQYHPNLDYITLREVNEGGDPMEDWVDYDPKCGASDDEETFNCDEILQTMRSIYAKQDANW